jgi:hypothetical protein
MFGTVSLGLAASSLAAAQSAGLPRNKGVGGSRTGPLLHSLFLQSATCSVSQVKCHVSSDTEYALLDTWHLTPDTTF